MYKLEFTLKQHTPIIHFQHDQDGATLRATEVKPKLDRFLIEKMGGKEKVNKSWFNNFEKGSLDYKLMIFAEDKPTFYWISSNPDSKDTSFKKGKDNDRINNANKDGSVYLNKTQYFGDNQYIDKNEKEWKNIRKGIKYDKVRLKITVLHDELRKEIQNSLDQFFCLHNFGTRQSKGFGCFLPLIDDDSIAKYLIDDVNIKGVFQIKSNKTFDLKIQDISSKYSLLKMGKGAKTGNYEKSKLWLFLCKDKEISWEKRKIKIHLLKNDKTLFTKMYTENSPMRLSPNSEISEEGPKAKDHFYIRALMGLAEQFEFLQFNDDGKIDFKNRIQVKVKDTLNNSLDDRLKELAVDRFGSPLRFLVTQSSIFLVAYDIPSILYEYTNPVTNENVNREFQFIIDNMATENNFNLKVPQNFDLCAFIEFSKEFGNNLKKKNNG
jgi:hypothetical protein